MNTIFENATNLEEKALGDQIPDMLAEKVLMVGFSDGGESSNNQPVIGAEEACSEFEYSGAAEKNGVPNYCDAAGLK